jgi:predicted acylesterase/phospholipase RssA/CRP-like cAMP-binding protein
VPIAADLVGRLSDRATTRDVAAGEVVITAGEAPDGLVRVVNGSLRVTGRRGRRTLLLGTLGPGDVVGEVSLLAGGRAGATVTALEDCVVEVVDIATARAVVAADPSLAEQLAVEAADRLDRNTLVLLLADLLDLDDASLLATAAQLVPLRRVPAGTVLLREGDPGDLAMLVVAGRLAVDRAGPDGPERLARLGRGQIVGEAALLTGRPRSATVTAVRDTVVAEIARETFLELASAEPRMLLAVMRQVVERASRPVGLDRHAVSTVALASVSPRVNTRVLSTRFVTTLSAFGPVGLLTPALVDRALEAPGLGMSEPEDPGAARVAALLHEHEQANELLVLEAGPQADGWSRRAARAADRFVVVLSGSPDAAEVAAARALLADVPHGTTTIAVLDHAADVERPRGTAALRDELGVDDVLHVRDGSAADLGRVARLVASRGVALVLGGGGARGFAHLGVQRALAELGVPVDLVVGSSIGAPLAGAIGCGVEHAELVPVATRLFDNLLDYTLPVVSLIKGERIAASIEWQFGDWDFEDTWIPFRCVTTNLTTSRSEVHASGPIAPMVRASVAIPGVMPPVPRGDDLLVDGGLLDNLPVDVAAKDGRCSTIIAVDVAPRTGPRARADYGLSVSGWEALRANLGRGRSHFPGITAVLLRSMLVGAMVNRDRQLEDAGVDLLLELPIRGTGLLEFDKVEPVAAEGYELALPLVEAWLADGGWLPATD